jgi:ATP-dependent RNA helicase RhlE
MSFSTFGLHPKLLQAVEDLGFEQPTPIQVKAIPPLMEGKDVLGAAATGSGKTAAFLLPILHKLMDKPRGTTRVLVLAPTRELAAQIADHFKALARHTALKGAAIYGGVGMEPQVQAFKRGVDVIVATPGRLLDHFQYPYAKLDGLEFVVLDEADRMLDMGFLPDVRRVLAKLPKKRQTMLFSATLPEPIVDLATEMLEEPVALNVERKSAPAKGISHAVFPVPHELKSHLLLELLKRAETNSVLAFTRTKHRANRLAEFLERRGVSVARIHGSRSQAQRTEALAGFKEGKYRVLVATDIAARGIDVEALGLVVNFDVPNIPEDYIHRVGRTARAELTGDAYTLVSPQEEPDLRGIERHLGKPLPRQKVDGFDYDHKPQERFEVPLADRIAAIRARRSEERARAKAKADRRPRTEGQEAGPAQPQARREHARKNGRAPDQRTPRPARGAAGSADGAQVPQGSSPAGAASKHGRRQSRRPEDRRHQAPQEAMAQRNGQHRKEGPRQDGQHQNRRDGQSRPSDRPRGDGQSRPQGRGGREDRHGQPRGRSGDRRNPKGGNRPFQPPPPPVAQEGFTFVRSSLRQVFSPGGPVPDTSGKREDVHRSHKDEVSGRSNWGKAWKRRSETAGAAQKPGEDREG